MVRVYVVLEFGFASVESAAGEVRPEVGLQE
jgi:hypothetical protein